VKQNDPGRNGADICRWMLTVSKKVADKGFALLKSLLHPKTNNPDMKKMGRELAALITDPGERNKAADALEFLRGSLAEILICRNLHTHNEYASPEKKPCSRKKFAEIGKAPDIPTANTHKLKGYSF